MERPESVLDFWFPPGHDRDEARHREQLTWWFRGGADAEIMARFLPLLEAAIAGQLDAWADTVHGRLALIIVLDQFSRSAFRDSPRAYAQDEKALGLAHSGMARGDLASLAAWERIFYSIPLAHSESLEMQDENVRVVAACIELVPPELEGLYRLALGQAQGHRDVIARFGRHPHRNAVLGRESTPEELEYVAAGKFVHNRPVLG